MNSFIIVGTDEDRKIYIADLAKQKGIAAFDLHVFEPGETSFGIEDVRLVQKAAVMKPLQGKEKFLIVNNAHLMTTEAQNALLKLLEEPPSNTSFFLSAATSAPFLPTILSRCKEIVVTKNQFTAENENFSEFQEVMEQGSVGTKMAFAEKIAADKTQLSQWFDTTLMSLRKKMLEEPENPLYMASIAQVQQARTLLQTTNVAPRMIVEHMLFSL